MQGKFVFSGHDTFQCRPHWLKKGYDFLVAGNSFRADDAVVALGVGKNMVNAIRFWLRAFDLVQQNGQDYEPTALAHFIFNDKYGCDPYLEDEATIWLLHYQLVKTGVSSIYSLVFNMLRKEKIDFDANDVYSYAKRQTNNAASLNENSINADFQVFTKLYTPLNKKDNEEIYGGIFSDLQLVKKAPENYLNKREGSNHALQVPNTEKMSIAPELVLYVILEQGNFDASLDLYSIELEANQVCSVFAMNRTGLIKKIEAITQRYADITYSEYAGVRQLQFKQKYNPLTILADYYAQN
jgi:hypothetical protein